MDLLRERSFSGLDSFLEPEQPKTGGRRTLLLVVLLAALGGAAWWTYTNYLGATEGRKPEPATSSAGAASTEKPSTQAGTQDTAPAPAAGSSQAAVPSAPVPGGGRVPESQAENASAGPDATRKTAEAATKPATEAKQMTPSPVAPAKTQPKTAPADKRAATREPGVAAANASASPSPTPATADTGDADFRKGEAEALAAAGENCAEAVKSLKAASAKSNAKARSAFGTMYATGHCVPRDLPTSYLWFAMALRVDPNNQILEKDLNAVWNQMTPPERQMATRMKQ